jgi:PQQ-dependent catabolism-associated CXXCW motif protein
MTARIIAGVLLALYAALCPAQGYADEDRDWGVAPAFELKRPPYAAPTPRAIPGARLVRTDDLRRLAAQAEGPLLIDVASGDGHVTLAGALWWPGTGRGENYLDPLQGEVAARLAQVTGGDKARQLVFFCVNSQCWLSYNASLRAVALGYGKVLWYRGGVEAWRAAGLPLAQVREPWRPAASLALPVEVGRPDSGR